MLARMQRQITLQPIMMNVGCTFTDVEMFGRRLNLSDARMLLSGLDQTQVLEYCAFLSAMIETGFGPNVAWNTPTHAKRLGSLLVDLLPPVHHSKALKLAALNQPFVPLIPQAVRALMKLACQFCPSTEGKPLRDVRYRQNVAKVLFGLQGALLSEVPQGNADLDWVYRAFPGVARCSLANRRLDLGREIGRLHGIVSRPEVGTLLEQQSGMTVEAWFNREFQLSAKDYRLIAQALAGYAGRFAAQQRTLTDLWLDLVSFQRCFEGLEKQVSRIWSLTATTVEKVVASQRLKSQSSLADVLYDPHDPLLVCPLLQVSNRYLVTSFDAVINKLVRGLPYLAHAVAQSDGVTGGQLHKGARSPTGLIFEGYARWITRERFRGSDALIFCGYQVDVERSRKGKVEAERDLLVVIGDIAFAIEVKAKVPTLADRASGDLNALVKLVSGLSEQAATAADALVSGQCCSDGGTALPTIRKVYPCVLVFERFPVRFPFSDAFEEELSKKQNRPLFKDSTTIGPLQIFDIDSYEEWDKAFQLPEEIDKLAVALQKRANTPELRYTSLCEVRKYVDGVEPKWKSLLEVLCDESEFELKSHSC